MNIGTMPTHVLHEFHQSTTDELKEQEQCTLLLRIQVEKNKVSMKKEIDQLIKDRDEACH